MTGQLVIVKSGKAYELVPKPVAEKIKQRDTDCIINTDHEVELEQDDEDPYADYKIPDDLIW
jgi:uncharacterized protein YaiL (DUF2058 family)